MENYSYGYSYPDSHDSSPRSRDNESWDDQQQQQQSSYKVKFMCSYNGKIQPRPHDNQLTYVGGETKILTVDRNIRFSNFISKLSDTTNNSNNEVSFKYQLPGEDLDALISVTNDEDLEHMMLEYDRLYRSSGSGASRSPARLRLFLFPLNSNQSSCFSSTTSDDKQWFLDALNSSPSVHQPSSPPAAASNPDFLFGGDGGGGDGGGGGFDIQPPPPLPQEPQPQQQVTSTPKLVDQKPQQANDVFLGGGGGGGDSIFEIQRQIQELQRLQITNQEQQEQQEQHTAMFQRKNEGNFQNYYMQEKPVSVPVPMPGVPPTGYWPQDHRHMTPIGAERQLYQQQQQVYMIPPAAAGGGMYQTPPGMNNVRPTAGGQGYYGAGVQRMVVGAYGMGPPQQQLSQQPPQPQQFSKMMMMGGEVGGGGGGGGGYSTTQVGYDSSGRQVYYTTSATTGVNVDPRQSGPMNQENKAVNQPPPPQSSVGI